MMWRHTEAGRRRKARRDLISPAAYEITLRLVFRSTGADAMPYGSSSRSSSPRMASSSPMSSPPVNSSSPVSMISSSSRFRGDVPPLRRAAAAPPPPIAAVPEALARERPAEVPRAVLPARDVLFLDPLLLRDALALRDPPELFRDPLAVLRDPLALFRDPLALFRELAPFRVPLLLREPPVFRDPPVLRDPPALLRDPALLRPPLAPVLLLRLPPPLLRAALRLRPPLFRDPLRERSDASDLSWLPVRAATSSERSLLNPRWRSPAMAGSDCFARLLPALTPRGGIRLLPRAHLARAGSMVAISTPRCTAT
jgi:hypothetical protein